jgi:holin-like protein
MRMEIDPVDLLVIPGPRAPTEDYDRRRADPEANRNAGFAVKAQPKARGRVWQWLQTAVRRAGRDAVGLAIILACLEAGTAIRTVLGGPIPGSIIGMGLLLLLFAIRKLPEAAVQAASADLLFILPALFIPLYAAPLSDADFWRHVGIVLLPAALGGAILMLLMTGGVARRVVRR